MNFEIPREKPSIIKVIGIGGGGSNAVNHMFRNGIKGVEFLVCNTDSQALETSPVPHKIQLGASLTEGRGAGSMPEVGKHSAIENLEDLRKALSDHTKMIFITAGMGGGTGTGAAPIIAGLAREMGILTVAIVTVPFGFEGKKRKIQAEAGIEELKKNVDTLLIICNDKLREIHGNLKLAEAFSHADNVLATAARSIAEIISVTLHINVDFADVQTVMKESGVAIMGSATASGENRATRAVELALDSPLLNDSNIEGARYILLNITSGNEEITMDEMGDITDFIQQQAGQTAEVIMGVGTDDKLGDKICVTIIATGFKTHQQIKSEKPVEKIVHKLQDYEKKETVVETFLPEKNELEPVLLSLEEADMPLFMDEEKVYEPEIVEPVIYHLEENVKADTVSEEIVQDEENIEADTEIKIINIEKETELQGNEKSENVFTFSIDSHPAPADDAVNTPLENPAVEEEADHISSSAEIPHASQQEPEKPAEDPHEELFRRSRERIRQLKELSYRFNNQQTITDMEKEPAFKRRNIKLEDTPPSSTSNISRFSLIEDQDKKVEIKPNSFLHDKVD